MKAIVLALLFLASTGSLLTARLVWPAGGSGDTMLLPVHSPTATPTPAAAQEAVQPDADGPEEPQPLTHRQSVLDRFVCVNCHGPEGGWPPPDDHASLGDDCTGCHAPAPEPAAIAIHRTPGEAATQPLCSLCHGDLVGGVPPQVAEAEECSSCHEEPDRRVVPRDHEGRSMVSCMVCHETRQLAVPKIQHRVKGWEECSFCHGKGRLTVPEGAHQDRKDDECLRCHDSTSTPPDVPRRMLQLSALKEGCTACHAEGRLAPLPLSHEGRTEALCGVCHTAVLSPAGFKNLFRDDRTSPPESRGGVSPSPLRARLQSRAAVCLGMFDIGGGPAGGPHAPARPPP